MEPPGTTLFAWCRNWSHLAGALFAFWRIILKFKRFVWKATLYLRTGLVWPIWQRMSSTVHSLISTLLINPRPVRSRWGLHLKKMHLLIILISDSQIYSIRCHKGQHTVLQCRTKLSQRVVHHFTTDPLKWKPLICC